MRYRQVNVAGCASTTRVRGYAGPHRLVVAEGLTQPLPFANIVGEFLQSHEYGDVKRTDIDVGRQRKQPAFHAETSWPAGLGYDATQSTSCEPYGSR